jgi:hypothetical protein
MFDVGVTELGMHVMSFERNDKLFLLVTVN